MFFKNDNIEYTVDPGAENAPERIVMIENTVPPREARQGLDAQGRRTSGIETVLQYAEAVKYRTAGAGVYGQAAVDGMWQAAMEFEKNESESDEETPSLKSAMSALCRKFGGAVKPKYFSTLDQLRLNLHKYGCAVLETMMFDTATPQTAGQQMPYLMTSASKIMTPDYTKGFVAVGYDKEGVFVQNTLGRRWGALGFGKLAWDLLTMKLPCTDGREYFVFVKGAVAANCYNGI